MARFLLRALNEGESGFSQAKGASATMTTIRHKRMSAVWPEPARASTLVGESDAIRSLRRLVRQVAPHDVPLVLIGEGGTGKRHVARLVHSLGWSRTGPFALVDCEALPESALALELFGCEAGVCVRGGGWPGKLELVRGGTLVLALADRLPGWALSRLLQTFDHLVVERLGAGEAMPIQVRLVVTAGEDPATGGRGGSEATRALERLSHAVVARVPPLRERPSDIGPLARHFLEAANRERGTSPCGFSEPATAALMEYDWPGNVAELRDCVRAAARAAGALVQPEHLALRVRAGGVTPGCEEAGRVCP